MSLHHEDTASSSATHSSRADASRVLTALLLGGVLTFGSAAVNRQVLAATTDACRLTSQNVLRACRSSAQSDYWIASGNCSNLADPSARRGCQQQAAADQRDGLETCDDQDDARDAMCARLGGNPYDPQIDPRDFVAGVDNPYFPLRPGTTFVYEGRTEQGFEHSEFSVTHHTKVILGVTCVEVRDTVKINGELTEDTLDWFAQDRDGNVWYFGENTHELVGGLITTLEGTFTAGIDSAKPGIVMEAHPAIGDFYRQEFSLANAEDLADVLRLNASVRVPAGSYTRCLKTQETTPLEPELLEHKYYAAGVGNVLTVDARSGARLELVRIITE